MREATTNILRHSNASRAVFDLSFGTKPAADNFPIVELQIRNDGAPSRSISTSTGTRGGSGLDGLIRRLADIGGQLDTETTPEQEFILRVSVPRSMDNSAAQDKDHGQ